MADLNRPAPRTAVALLPRLTRAAFPSNAREGRELINTTGHREALLARENRLCHASLATDSDAGISEILALATKGLKPGRCTCATWLEDFVLPFHLS